MVRNNLKILISADALFQEIRNRQGHPELHLTLINVQSSKYFDDCRIEGSINIEANKIADYVDDWDRTEAIVLYGASEDISLCKEAYHRLLDMGFESVRILMGGMAEWFGKSYPSQGVCKKEYLKK